MKYILSAYYFITDTLVVGDGDISESDLFVAIRSVSRVLLIARRPRANGSTSVRSRRRFRIKLTVIHCTSAKLCAKEINIDDGSSKMVTTQQGIIFDACLNFRHIHTKKEIRAPWKSRFIGSVYTLHLKA